eukprot:11095814-Alexandrium_andersonii.AAC.1
MNCRPTEALAHIRARLAPRGSTPRGHPSLLTSNMLKSLQAFELGTARAQTRPQNRSQKLSRGAFCAGFRADAESADESG